jgi:hypothetical protein
VLRGISPKYFVTHALIESGRTSPAMTIVALFGA